jgi:hypothetical protein
VQPNVAPLCTTTAGRELPLDDGGALQPEANTLDLSTYFALPDTAFATGNFSLPFSFDSATLSNGEQGSEGVSDRPSTDTAGIGDFDASGFSWLLPGGSIPYYFPNEQG